MEFGDGGLLSCSVVDRVGSVVIGDKSTIAVALKGLETPCWIKSEVSDGCLVRLGGVSCRRRK